MQVHIVQWDIAWEAPAQNRLVIQELLANRSIASGDLVVLPETCFTGFTMSSAFAEHREVDGETADRQWLAHLARQLEITLVAGVIENSQNVALVYGPSGTLLAHYAKQRPFLLGGEVWTAGTAPAMFLWNALRVCPFICYDLRFPELFRTATSTWQPELLLVIASWPEPRIHHWTRLLIARAIENQCYVAGVNRTGTDPTFRYVGASTLVDWNGDTLLVAGHQPVCMGEALDITGLLAYRKAFPFIQRL